MQANHCIHSIKQSTCSSVISTWYIGVCVYNYMNDSTMPNTFLDRLNPLYYVYSESALGKPILFLILFSKLKHKIIKNIGLDLNTYLLFSIIVRRKRETLAVSTDENEKDFLLEFPVSFPRIINPLLLLLFQKFTNIIRRLLPTFLKHLFLFSTSTQNL